MNTCDTAVVLTTKCGVFLTLEEYRELREAEPYKRLMRRGYTDVVIVHYEDEIRLTVPANTTLLSIAKAVDALGYVTDFKFGYSFIYEVKNSDGVLLEVYRSVDQLGFKYGERLWISK